MDIEVVGQMLWKVLYKQSALAFHYTADYLRWSRSVAQPKRQQESNGSISDNAKQSSADLRVGQYSCIIDEVSTANLS